MSQKLLLKLHLSPGDIVCMTAAIRELHTAYPGLYETAVDTICNPLFDHNPYIAKFAAGDDVWTIQMNCPLIHQSDQRPVHFLHSWCYYLGDKLGRRIEPMQFKGDVYVSDEEKGWIPQVEEITGETKPYIIINSGSKTDFTNKQWSRFRYQQVVDKLPHRRFVQVGELGHNHVPLTGDNVVNLVGMTDTRQFVRLMYHSPLVISPSSFAMHLAAAVPFKNEVPRGCIVVGGGREPVNWQLYRGHTYLGQTGHLPCCLKGACWKSRIEALPDGDVEKNGSLCEMPVFDEANQRIPKCLSLITADEIAHHIELNMTARGL